MSTSQDSQNKDIDFNALSDDIRRTFNKSASARFLSRMRPVDLEKVVEDVERYKHLGNVINICNKGVTISTAMTSFLGIGGLLVSGPIAGVGLAGMSFLLACSFGRHANEAASERFEIVTKMDMKPLAPLYGPRHEPV